VNDLAGFEQAPALAEVADDLLLRLGGRGPVQPAVAVVEAARLVDRGEDGKVVLTRELEVLGTAARSSNGRGVCGPKRPMDEEPALVTANAREDAVPVAS
jgi:hypothetical protein